MSREPASELTRACSLCGAELGLELRLVEYTAAVEKALRKRFDHIDICIDRGACRARVELELKEPWPIADGTPPPARPAPPPADPLPSEPSSPPVAEEALPWLR